MRTSVHFETKVRVWDQIWKQSDNNLTTRFYRNLVLDSTGHQIWNQIHDQKLLRHLSGEVNNGLG